MGKCTGMSAKKYALYGVSKTSLVCSERNGRMSDVRESKRERDGGGGWIGFSIGGWVGACCESSLLAWIASAVHKLSRHQQFSQTMQHPSCRSRTVRTQCVPFSVSRYPRDQREPIAVHRAPVFTRDPRIGPRGRPTIDPGPVGRDELLSSFNTSRGLALVHTASDVPRVRYIIRSEGGHGLPGTPVSL